VGSSLSDQALNASDVPLAIEKCIGFVALHGYTLLCETCTCVFFSVLLFILVNKWLLNLKSQICYGCQCLSVVCLMVISLKLSKIDPQLLWNSVRKLAWLILLLHYSDPPSDNSPGNIFGSE